MKTLILWTMGIIALNLGIYLYICKLINNQEKTLFVIVFIAIIIAGIISTYFSSTSTSYAVTRFSIAGILIAIGSILTSIIAIFSVINPLTIFIINALATWAITMAAIKCNNDEKIDKRAVFMLTVVEFSIIFFVVYNNLPKG